MMICDFLELCGSDQLEVELVNIKTGEKVVVGTDEFVCGDYDGTLDHIIYREIRGWNHKHGRLVLEY